MIKFARFGLLSSLLIGLSYLLYILPFTIAGSLLLDTPLTSLSYLWPTLVIAAVLFLYMRTHSASPILSFITYYGMGIGFTCLWVFSLALLVASLLPDHQFQAGLAGLITAIALNGKALFNARQITPKTLTITSPAIDQKTTFVFISDVHLGSNEASHLAKIVKNINQQTYDFLIIGGDLFDSSAFTSDQLAPLTDIPKPIYYITGNHEYYVKDSSHKLDNLVSHNITTLNDEARFCHGVNMIGISDNQPVSQQIAKAAGLMRDDVFNLLLVHQPGLWGKQPAQTDLMLSGHTHNGQIFPFNWLVRLQFSAPYGLYQDGKSQLYVSSGAGTWGPKMRLGSRNEIVHITITPA